MKGALPEAVARNLAVTDSQSLYDSLQREVREKERQVALAVAEIKLSMAA